MPKSCEKQIEVRRRAFFARTAVVTAGAAAAMAVPGAPARSAPALALVTYPSSRLANINDLKVNEPAVIAYPDDDSPGVLIKLGSRVEGGAGPTAISSPSAPCARTRASRLAYSAADKSLNCPGHYSRFDGEKGGLQIFGHATQNLPQFRLVLDQQGDIHAVGVDELIYGRLSNVCRHRGPHHGLQAQHRPAADPAEGRPGPQRRLPLLHRRLRLSRALLAGRSAGRHAARPERLRRRPDASSRRR